MKHNRFELEIESNIDNLPVIYDFLTKGLEQVGVDQGTAYKVHLAVDEACTNVIKHAYSGGSGSIKLILELVGDDIEVTISDRGKAFDVTKVPPPDLGADLQNRRNGGLGIYFMRKLMDEVNYIFDGKKGNQLIMKKHITQKSGD